jgi:hypothetical protein
MTIQLVIKNVKPYKTIKPVIDGQKSVMEFGIRLYNPTEAEALSKEFQALAINNELRMASAKLEKWVEEGDKTTEEFYTTEQSLKDVVESLAKGQRDKINDFYRKQIIFAGNISTSYGDKDITVIDTRTVQPIESLWSTPEECLAVLLGALMEVPSIWDSLTSDILSVIFNTYKEEKVKN